MHFAACTEAKTAVSQQELLVKYQRHSVSNILLQIQKLSLPTKKSYNLKILPQKHLTDFARRHTTEGMHFEFMKACICIVWPYIWPEKKKKMPICFKPMKHRTQHSIHSRKTESMNNWPYLYFSVFHRVKTETWTLTRSLKEKTKLWYYADLVLKIHPVTTLAVTIIRKQHIKTNMVWFLLLFK